MKWYILSSVFLTGSDRIPILGMKSLKLVIQPTGGGEQYLPVAHTCFNLLDLPMYSSLQTLREKLLQAIDHNQGFNLAWWRVQNAHNSASRHAQVFGCFFCLKSFVCSVSCAETSINRNTLQRAKLHCKGLKGLDVGTFQDNGFDISVVFLHCHSIKCSTDFKLNSHYLISIVDMLLFMFGYD